MTEPHKTRAVLFSLIDEVLAAGARYQKDKKTGQLSLFSKEIPVIGVSGVTALGRIGRCHWMNRNSSWCGCVNCKRLNIKFFMAVI